MDIRRALPVSACLALALVVGAAGAAGQTVTLNQGGKDVRIAIGDAAALPAAFPADIALPQPHTVVRVQRSGAAMTVDVETPAATVDEAAARFRADMLAAGWTAAAVRRPPSGRAQAWEKDGRAVVAWLTPAEAGVRMQLELLPAGGTAASAPAP